jgi:hypothetical protein
VCWIELCDEQGINWKVKVRIFLRTKYPRYVKHTKKKSNDIKERPGIPRVHLKQILKLIKFMLEKR